jgi:UDP-N-acetylmuramoyl-L-alanyl-D-glutamate--2,6-diaminopimelate ligase
MTMIANKKSSISLHRLLADFVSVEIDKNRQVSGLTMDSRELHLGDVFLAMPGFGADGRDFIAQAIQSGVVAVVIDISDGWTVSAELSRLAAECDVVLLTIVNLPAQLGAIAARFYGEPSTQMSIVGITGTNGKTSVSQFVAQCLHQGGRSCGLIGTLGNGLWGQLGKTIFTTPLAIDVQRNLSELQQQGADYVAMEVSSHGLHQGRVNAVQFDVAVLTNLSRDHLDYHGDMQAYADVKASLFQMDGLQHAIVNLDDQLGQRLWQQLDAKKLNLLGYTLGMEELSSSDCRDLLQGRIIERDQQGSLLEISGSYGEAELHINLLGEFNVSNALATLASLLVLGLPLAEAVSRVSCISAPAGRMECFRSEDKPLAVVDYAHTPDALGQVLRTLRDHCDERLWLVFGCGGDRDKGKRAEMAKMAEALADKIIVTNDNPRTEDADGIIRDILSGFDDTQDIQVLPERGQAIRYALSQAKENDIVLLAGKGHEDYQIVGTERIYFSDRDVVSQFMEEAA